MIKIKVNHFAISIIIHSLILALVLFLMYYKKTNPEQVAFSGKYKMVLKNMSFGNATPQRKLQIRQKVVQRQMPLVKNTATPSQTAVKKIKSTTKTTKNVKSSTKHRSPSKHTASKVKSSSKNSRKKYKTLDNKSINNLFGNTKPVKSSKKHKYYAKNVEKYLSKKQHYDSKAQSVRSLYGAEFINFSAAQKRFIKKNLQEIATITQKVLYERGYPVEAIKFREYGIAVVQFYLHSNGDISNLHVIYTSGHRSLNQNTIDTVKAAYKDYPRPSSTTLIRIAVKYYFY